MGSRTMFSTSARSVASASSTCTTTHGTSVAGPAPVRRTASSRPTPAITENSSRAPFVALPRGRTTSGTSTPPRATDATSPSILRRSPRSPGCGRFN